MQLLNLEERKNLRYVDKHVLTHVSHIFCLSDAPFYWYKVLLIVVASEHSILHARQISGEFSAALRQRLKQEHLLLDECLSRLHEVLLTKLKDAVFLLCDVSLVLELLDLLVQLSDLFVVEKLQLLHLVLELFELVVATFLLFLFLLAEASELRRQLLVVLVQLHEPLFEILAFLVFFGDAALKLANLVMIFFRVVFLQLIVLFNQFLVEGILRRLDLLLEQDDLRLEVDDDFFFVCHILVVLLFQMVNHILLRRQLRFALLVVNAQILVLYLDLVEELLNLAQVSRVIL